MLYNSFNDMNNDELLAVAEQFAVDGVSNRQKKETILKKIEEDGVTFEMWRSLQEEIEDEQEDLAELDQTPLNEPVTEEAEGDGQEEILVKMTRRNKTYEVRGYRFTQQHPYALVKEEDADYLIEFGGGFRQASPKEAREFYGL